MTGKVRILYMEDNEGLARLLQKRLVHLDYAVDLAANGETGIELCAEFDYDVIIVDYNMPGLNGIQVIQQLAENGALPPTIMLTGTGNEQIAVEALKLGAFDYVVKDIDAVYLDLLPNVIEQSLQYHQFLKDKELAEKKLERSEKYYRALIENSLDLIVLTDGMGVVRYLSPSFRDIFGFDEQELIGKSALSLLNSNLLLSIDQSFSDDVRNFYRALLESSNQPLERQFQVQDRNGRWRWLEVRGRNLLHEPGIEAIVFNVRDITERKQAEEALRESEERFRMLFEMAPDPIFINDLSGNLIDVNQAVEPLLGLEKADLIGKNFVDMQIMDSEELAKVDSALASFVQGTVLDPSELIINRTDGKKVVIDLRVMPVQSKGGIQILGIGHDITWRKQAEMQMKTYIQQLEILRQIDDELTRKLDVQYVQTMALDHMMKLSGANAGSIVLVGERGVSDLQVRGYSEKVGTDYFLEKRSIVARAAQAQRAEWVQQVAADSDYIPLRADTCSQMVFPLISQKRLVGIVNLETNQPDCFYTEMFEFLKLISARIAVAIDNAQLYESRQQQLIELQNLYEKISGLEQLKTDMIRLAAHDLRNPLSSILTKTYLLRKTVEPEARQPYIDEIDLAVGRMQTMITDFLSVERIEEKMQGDFSGQEVNLGDLVLNIAAIYDDQAREKGQAIHFSIPQTPCIVRGGRAELQQVIINLIGNAIKYTPPGGRIEVILQEQAMAARFEVVDTGYGIPADQQSKLFQPFFRAQTVETMSIEGTGLGLYLVKRIVERNRGELIFCSEYGKGSVFGFTLPLV